MKLNKILALLLCFALAFCPVSIMAENAEPTRQEAGEQAQASEEKAPILTDGEMAKRLVEQCAHLLMLQYKDEVTREQLYEDTLMKIMEKHPEIIEDAYEAMFSGLDKHSRYYTEEDYNYFIENMSGEFVGIGVIINKIDQGLMISSSTANSSAAQAGIRQGDIITTVDGISIVGMDIEKARTYITGEIDTTVVIGVLRNNEYLEFTVTRRPVIVESGRYQILEGNIGFIQLDSFDETSPLMVNAALDLFDSKGITDIIFDLRFNGGGSVNALSEICQRIIPSGPIIHFDFKRDSENYTVYSNCQDAKYNLVVLANDYSASASEAFCGAVQDSKVGIVVGTTTYGKGSMQTLTNFRIGGGVKLTVAEYLTRDKRHIDGIGIKPDFYVEDKVIKIGKAGFNSFDYVTKPKLGDKGPEVLALNQRLWAMGYDVGIPSDEFTEETHNAVYMFQASCQGLTPYGVCDISTQLELERVMQGVEFYDDAIFKTAVDIVKAGSLEKYQKLHNN